MTGDRAASRTHASAAAIGMIMLVMAGIAAVISGAGAQAAESVPTGLVINEFMADNGAAIRGPDGTYPDWVELYNGGDYPVNLSGLYLADNLDKPTWQFRNGSVIEAKGYLLVWADGAPSQGALHADFKLRANGEAVGLFAADGKTLIDSISYGKQIEDVSYGRLPDGSSGWSYLTSPTPGESNVENPRTSTSTPWPMWMLIALGIVASAGVLVRDRIRERRHA